MAEIRWEGAVDAARAHVPPMFGRADERDRVLMLLRGPQRLVTLTGRGGVGKTRLAEAVLAEWSTRTGDHAVLVPLAAVTEPALVAGEIAAKLGASTTPGGDAETALLRAVGDDERLLVLDNFEHLVDAGPVVAHLLDECPELRILVTSQTPLRLRAELVVDVAPLPVPAPDATTADLATSAAVQLYCDRAAAAHGGFRLDDRNAPAVAELCRRLEGLPLAIELAAVRAAALPAPQILELLDAAPLDVLRQARTDVNPRHHDLRAAIAWTVGLLAAPQRRLLRRLASTVAPFDVATAAALDEEPAVATANRLAALADLRLLELVDDDPARWSMPWSIREFGREQLRAAGEETAVRTRLVLHQADRAAQIATGIDDGDPKQWYAVATAETTALVHALEDAAALGLTEAGLTIVPTLGRQWSVRGYGRDHLRLVEAVVPTARPLGLETPAFVEALAWSTFLRFPSSRPAEHGELTERLRTARAAAARIDDPDTRLRVLVPTVLCLQYTGDLDFTTDAISEAFAVLDRDDHPRRRARFEVYAAMVAHLEGDDSRAVELGLRGLAGATRADDSRTRLGAAALLQDLAVRHPELEASVPSIEEILELARSDGYVTYEAALGAIAALEAMARDEPYVALTRCDRTLTLARSLADDQSATAALVATVVVLAGNGQFRPAARYEGAVEEALPRHEPRMLARHVDVHRDAVATVRRELGPAEFAVARHRGAGLTLGGAVREALPVVRDLVRRRAPDAPATPDDLTPRQRDTLRLVVAGCTNKEIAAQLGIRPKTVTHHLGVVFRVAGVRTRTEAAMWARGHGVEP